MHPPASRRWNVRARRSAFTLLEVMVSTMLIAVAMGSILVMNARAARILRASREVAAASQVLQQRIEMLRERPWAEVSGSQALVSLMRKATDSEAEMANSNLTERLKVTVPQSAAEGFAETKRTFTIVRSSSGVVAEGAGDFSTEPTLLFEGTAVWRDQGGVHQRALRTVVCRHGLTRSGVVGTVLGQPGARVTTVP